MDYTFKYSRELIDDITAFKKSNPPDSTDLTKLIQSHLEGDYSDEKVVHIIVISRKNSIIHF